MEWIEIVKLVIAILAAVLAFFAGKKNDHNNVQKVIRDYETFTGKTGCTSQLCKLLNIPPQ